MSILIGSHPNWIVYQICDDAACRLRQRLTMRDVFYVMDKGKFGGTKKEAAYRCRQCQGVKVIPRQFLPKGAFEHLPSLSDFENKPGIVSANKEPAPVPGPVADPSPVPPLPLPISRPAAIKAAAVPVVPRWLTGKQASEVMRKDLARARQPGGQILAFQRGANGLLSDVQIDISSNSVKAILSHLDQLKIELLVLTGQNADLSRWKTIFHPFAGAATMMDEPAHPEPN